MTRPEIPDMTGSGIPDTTGRVTRRRGRRRAQAIAKHFASYANAIIRHFLHAD